jgi:hypothetical protein
MSMVDKLASFLEEEKILPISKKTWSTFKLSHCIPENEQKKKEQFSFIRCQVEKRAGIYIYFKNEKCLYIGKAKQLYDRIKSHYIESFSTVPGDTKDMRWHRFFSQHQDEVEIFWKEFQSEEERQIVEILLTKLLKPIFLEYK